MYSVAGLVLALAVGGAAWQRSRRGGGYYDREVYGMDRKAHLRYAVFSALFAAFFAVSWSLGLARAGIVALALYVLSAVLYGSSFLRGAADQE